MSLPISGTTRLIAIFGHPLTYTLSPAFQNQGLAQLGCDMAYVPLPAEPASFEAAFLGFKAAQNAVGANVTNPFKQAVTPLLDRISPEARAIGAVNTVWRKAGKWRGTNTDAAGVTIPLGRELRLRPHVWLSTEWFSPDGVPGIALPFYLAHPRLESREICRSHRGERCGGVGQG